MRDVVLQKDQHRRVLAGHDWIYSNEIDNNRTPLKGYEPGESVNFLSQHGKWLARGYLNPHSLIAGRVLTRDHGEAQDATLLRARIGQALELRSWLYAEPFYRLVYGEADGLPGLVVDRYDDVLVAQVGTAGMERLTPLVVEALVEATHARGVLLKNDSPSRALEGLPAETRVAHGQVADDVAVREGGLAFRVPVIAGQKTGWFFDQADNRTTLQRFLRGGPVLDVFSYVGAWGLRAAAAGASDVVCVDSSASALERVQANASANGLTGVRTEKGDAFDVLEALGAAGERFETVIVDPPAFIKRRKDQKAGAAAYERINALALRLVAPGGVLVSASCSQHLSTEELQRCVQRAARRSERTLTLLTRGGQGPDHPVQPAMPETDYLKALFFRVL
ncbi:MAG: class I SAM-dependent rRNA methyltransferase [Pseudomonadales bacterium]|nr:class I SAM-dependent rRNA methyltransferase [Pseudomonadales bacterium]MCP5184791.1 class I SAM-dependent rRNA methyltransferase [Pseudomonadales bacterium]